jgi:hypothetical protein
MQVGDPGEEEGKEENCNATDSTSVEDLQARRFDLVHVFGYATMRQRSARNNSTKCRGGSVGSQSVSSKVYQK